MPKTIVQKVVFKNTTPGRLYSLYMDPKKHTEVTGAPAKITAKEGTRFSAFDKYISGTNLHLVKDKLIVQSWRGSDWKAGDSDSTFIIHLEQKGKDVLLHATHANVPDSQASGIGKGWHDYYWNPWKRHLSGKAGKKNRGM